MLPTHCKNDIWPEPRSEDVFKELDHAFQPMSKSWRLRTSLYGWDASIFPHLPVEEDDKGVDLLDLLLQELHQLLHSLTIALNIISKAWLDLDRKQLTDWSPILILILVYQMPGVSITVTGFSSSPSHLNQYVSPNYIWYLLLYLLISAFHGPLVE